MSVPNRRGSRHSKMVAVVRTGAKVQGHLLHHVKNAVIKFSHDATTGAGVRHSIEHSQSAVEQLSAVPALSDSHREALAHDGERCGVLSVFCAQAEESVSALLSARAGCAVCFYDRPRPGSIQVSSRFQSGAEH